MKKIYLILAALIVSSLLFVGCGGGSSSGGDSGATTVTINGVVKDATDTVVSGAVVELYNMTSGTPLEISSTNAKGEYSFAPRDPGNYKIIVYKGNDFALISNDTDYTSYKASNTPYVKNIVVKPFSMNDDALTGTIKYTSTSNNSTWTLDSRKPITTDSRNIINVYYDATTTKGDSEHFNNYVKFSDGSISKIAGQVVGSTWDITKEVPVCNASLTDFSVGTYTVTVTGKELKYISGLGEFFVAKCEVTSTDPTFTTSYYYVSPDFGWFVQYQNDFELFTIKSYN